MARWHRAALAAALLSSAVLPSARARADDGWLAAEGSVGPIYSETEHASVRLVAETLEISRPKPFVTEAANRRSAPYAARVRAVLIFENESENPVRVRAGFPVRLQAPPSRESGFWDVAAYLALVVGEKPVPGRGIGWDAVPKLPVRERFPSPAALEKKVGLGTGVMRQISEPVLHLDGERVLNDAVIVEGQRQDDALVATTHYLHTLEFPRGRSELTVAYTHDDRVAAESGFADAHHLIYVLGTGRTWKGEVRRIVLSLPDGELARLPEAFRYVSSFGGQALHEASGYEPGVDDAVELEFRHEALGLFEARDPPAAPALTSKARRSMVASLPRLAAPRRSTWFTAQPSKALAGRTTAFRRRLVWPIEGIARGRGESPSDRTGPRTLHRFPSTFGSQAVVDNLDETAWCEGVEGDGIATGLTLHFQRPVAAVEVVNGFIKYGPLIRVPAAQRPFKKNNRVRRLEVRRVETGSKKSWRVATATLRDTEHPQRYTLSMPAGAYRFVIRSVFRGSVYRDTCLGELRFLPGDPLYRSLQWDPARGE